MWPFLRYICCCFVSKKKSFKFGLKKALKYELGMKNSKSDEQIDEDPYLLLGFGMNSYFNIMLNLMFMMLIASCFGVALMSRFSEYSALTIKPGLHVFSMGNMGGAESLCEVAQITDPNSAIHLQCQAGLIDTEVLSQGTDS